MSCRYNMWTCGSNKVSSRSETASGQKSCWEPAQRASKLASAVARSTRTGPRIGDDPDEPVLRQRAGSKPGWPLVDQPVVCDFMVGVIGMEQRDQDADVEHALRLVIIAQGVHPWRS